MKKVFLSSTGRDLMPFREAAFETIQRLDDFTCIRMEDFGAIDRDPVTHCRDKVAQADVVVGIIGLNYGASPPGDETSFTEHEYNAAVAMGIPRLMFVAPEDFPLPGTLRESDTLWQKQQRFRDRIRNEHIVTSFNSPDQLAAHVAESLNNWQRTQDTSQLLSVPHRVWHPDLDPPGALLRADFGIVPFHGREQERRELGDWTESDQPIGVRLYTGAGGMGKTRLALEVCRMLSDVGWTAGFLDHRNPNITDERLQRLIARAERLLVVIDYSETCRDLLVNLISAVRQHASGKVRVLLLARNAGDWWEVMKREAGGVGDLMSGPATKRVTLAPLALTIEARRHSYHLACTELAKVLEKPVPQTEPEDFEAAYFERVLLLHMNALAAVDEVEVKGEDGILDYILNRERRFWSGLATTRGLPVPMADGIGRAMAAFTLGGGADNESEAIYVLEFLEFFRGVEQPIRHAVVRLLHDSYPGKKWIEPVQPDLLGEHLVEKELDVGEDELFDLVFGPQNESRNG